MEPSIQRMRPPKQFPTEGRRAGVALAVTGSAAVQFPVFSRVAEKRPATIPEVARQTLMIIGYKPVFRPHEEPPATTDESTSAAHPRIVARHDSNARGAVVSGCFQKAVTDAARVVAGGKGPGAQTRERRSLNQAGNRFTESNIGSRPMAGIGS